MAAMCPRPRSHHVDCGDTRSGVGPSTKVMARSSPTVGPHHCNFPLLRRSRRSLYPGGSTHQGRRGLSREGCRGRNRSDRAIRCAPLGMPRGPESEALPDYERAFIYHSFGVIPDFVADFTSKAINRGCGGDRLTPASQKQGNLHTPRRQVIALERPRREATPRHALPLAPHATLAIPRQFHSRGRRGLSCAGCCGRGRSGCLSQ